jgi:hypothetical protein
MWTDPRDSFIARVTPGRTFVDVGGLVETVKEKVSVAAEHGATRLAMIDVRPEEDDLWRRFRERLEEKGVGSCECVSGDIQKLAVNPFDIVHSSGVLYHLPNPFLYLEKLRELAREFVILTSTIFPREIATRSGTMRVPAGSAVFLPALSEGERTIVDEYWRKKGYDILLDQHRYTLTDFVPTWWVPTIATLKGMCECAGFEIVEEGDWKDYFPAHTLLLRP